MPEQYDATYKRYAAQGARVIALAHRRLGDESAVEPVALRATPREELEKGLDWAGFAVFSVGSLYSLCLVPVASFLVLRAAVFPRHDPGL